MELIPRDIRARLLQNGAAPDGADHVPVVKFFDPCGAATWLITESLPHEPDLLFGLCDLGTGFPELGYVRLSELSVVAGRLGLGIERDLSFKGLFPISVYAEAARTLERITEDTGLLAHAAAVLGKSPAASIPPNEDG